MDRALDRKFNEAMARRDLEEVRNRNLSDSGVLMTNVEDCTATLAQNNALHICLKTGCIPKVWARSLARCMRYPSCGAGSDMCMSIFQMCLQLLLLERSLGLPDYRANHDVQLPWLGLEAADSLTETICVG